MKNRDGCEKIKNVTARPLQKAEKSAILLKHVGGSFSGTAFLKEKTPWRS
ncbi:MAG: hypothetical protein OSJ58_07535 [Dysosmobacter sp.]|nr:hypothetical protein [Dysosmobacter sp.]